MIRRKFLILSSAVLMSCATFSARSAEQDARYPSKPIKIVVPFAAGGSSDFLARLLADNLSKDLGQPVIVENKPGAAGNIAAAAVVKSPADGYTIFMGTSATLAVNPYLYKSMPYSPVRDVRPIVLATTVPAVIVVNADTQINSLQALISYAAKNGDSVSFASTGFGAPPHLAGELFKKLAKLPELVHVPYTGGAPALTGLIGKQTTMMFALVPEALSFIQSGKLRALAATSLERVPQLPEVPTATEAGLKNFVSFSWYAFVAPKATPDATINKLNNAFNKALSDPKVKERLADMGFVVVGGTPQALGNMMNDEAKKWSRVIKESGITIE